MAFKFEWDDAKAEANFRKHGVSFEHARNAFNDRHSVEWIDRDLGYGEERILLLGLSDGTILKVIFTERGEITRLISARRATRHERKIYHVENGL